MSFPARPVDLRVLQAVDREVRRLVSYQLDRLKRGWPDNWKIPKDTLRDKVGDCEDFAMVAARLLLTGGVAPSNLYFTTISTKGGRTADHVALVAQTEQGLTTCADTYVPEVRPLTHAYRLYEMRQWMNLGRPGRWRYW